MSDDRSSEELVAQRSGGATYQAIALLHGISVARVRYICRRAVLSGRVTAEQIGWVRRPKPLRIAPEDYDEHWIKRVMRNVIQDANGCWIWQRFKSAKGYGYTNYRGKNAFVHRRMFEITHSVTLKTEEFVCHSCDVRACCNPSHLWKGDAKANNTDSRDKGTHYEARRTECQRGHPLSGDNVRIEKQHPPKTGIRRTCKACERGRMRIAAGWPKDLAYSMGPVPHGYRPVNAKRKKAA